MIMFLFLFFVFCFFLIHLIYSDFAAEEKFNDEEAENANSLEGVLNQQKLPDLRPVFLSDRHFAKLSSYYKDEKKLDPRWLDSYYKNIMATVRVYPDDAMSNRRNENEMFLTQRFNEFVLLSQVYNIFVFTDPHSSFKYTLISLKLALSLSLSLSLPQLIAASAPFNNLLVASIILAGTLVGVQTYPSMAHNSALNALNWVVQAVFTVDCVLKILREGVNPLNYWFVHFSQVTHTSPI